MLKKLAGIGNVLVAGIFIAMTSISVFIPTFIVAESIQDHLVHILFILLLAGLIGLIISNHILLYASFGSAAFIAFFLKSASNTELKNPQINDEDKFAIAHINLSISDLDEVKKVIAKKEFDVISFQEYTPDWEDYMISILDSTYKYSVQHVRIDIYGKVIVSKYPIIQNKNILFDDIYNLDVNIEKDNKTYRVISTYLMPALDKTTKQQAKDQFSILENVLSADKQKLIILGEFNQVYWSNDILTFRNKSGLHNSRRNVSLSKFKMPYDHIFYTADMECFKFEELNDSYNNHIGCAAFFQFKKSKIRRL